LGAQVGHDVQQPLKRSQFLFRTVHVAKVSLAKFERL